MVHHRRDDLSVRPGPKQSTKAPKVITFADNLEVLGSWNDDFRENERTDVYQTGPGQVRFHPQTDNIETWYQYILKVIEKYKHIIVVCLLILIIINYI